jgi:hypothetical protein
MPLGGLRGRLTPVCADFSAAARSAEDLSSPFFPLHLARNRIWTRGKVGSDRSTLDRASTGQRYNSRTDPTLCSASVGQEAMSSTRASSVLHGTSSHDKQSQSQAVRPPLIYFRTIMHAQASSHSALETQSTRDLACFVRAVNLK